VKVAFAGSPPAAVTVLRALLARGVDVRCVISQPDRPKGRGGKTIPTAVSAEAMDRGLRLERPASINAPELLDDLARLDVAAICVVGFGQLLRERVLGDWLCINVHFSVLPAYRGAAPVERAIMDGCTATGVTIMRMDAGLDTGPIIRIGEMPIGPEDDAGAMLERLAVLGGDLLVITLEDLAGGTLTMVPQPEEGVSLAPKITDEDIRLDLTLPAHALANRVRALSPHIGAALVMDGQRFKIWRAHATDLTLPSGEAVARDRQLLIPSAAGVLVVDELQPPNRSRMTVEAFLRGWRGGFALATPPA
jgi:methionyl-tRNA formyltransferase